MADTEPSGTGGENIRYSSSSIIALLQEIQNIYGYLPRDIIKKTAIEHSIPLSRLFAIATFYNAFSLEEQGRHIISVCHGTACHVKKAKNLSEAIARHLNLSGSEGTTPDRLFSLKKVRCLGCCSMAPVIKIDDTIHGTMTQTTVIQVLRKLQKGMLHE
ncbi:MAG: NAD(P)H-dependent oxidoreductase subunit E [Desulfobacterota bacterium]|nr:NAD(P)H-dependent oxidoreductase subunit E [Thermodesulfobacteriota bacterium]